MPTTHRRCAFLLVLAVPLLLAACAAPALARGSTHRPRHRVHRAHVRVHCAASARARRHRRARCTYYAKSLRHALSYAPANSSPPSVSGSAVQGQALSAQAGSWTGSEPMRYAYQWQREGVSVGGATASSYTLGAADVGHTIDVLVTASNSAGSASAASAATAPVSAQAPTVETAPAPAPAPVPAVSAIAPSSGPEAGGTLVGVSGSNLAGVVEVRFGAVRAPSFSVISEASLSAVAPAGTGVQDVTVVTAGGASSTSPADQFAYVAPENVLAPETWHGLSAWNPMPAGQTPGGAVSPFNLRVEAPAVLPNSGEMVSWLLSHYQSGSHMPGSVEPQQGRGAPTVYASNSDPVVELVATESWGPNALQGRKIRVPAAAQPGYPPPPGDAHLEIVLAPADAKVPGETADLWRAEAPREGRLRFAWGGPGNIAGTLLGGAATASDIDLSAGKIRAPELKAGVVPHALCAAVPQTKSTYVYPASKSDGKSTEAAAPAMGQRFYLAYTDAEIQALSLPPWKKAVLEGLAHYGFYVCDSGNDTLGFEFESSRMYTAFGAPEMFSEIGREQGLPTWEGRYVFNFSNGVDWTRLRAIAPPS